MPLQQFTLDSLKDLDGGKALLAFSLHIQRAAIDCMDRPGETKARKVTLEVSFVPVMDGDDCNEVEAQIKAKSTVPVHQTKAYSFGLRKNGTLVFNADSPDRIDQATLLSGDDE